MADSGTRPIVVGVDGSPESVAAARWAVVEAGLRQLTVQLVGVYSWPAPPMPLSGLPPEVTGESLRDAAERAMATIVDEMRGISAAVSLTGTVVPGLPAHTLIELSDRATMVVVGHRGRGGFAALMLGSVAGTVAAHAQCPVAVVRSPGPPSPAAGTVLVGVDGSPHSDAAVGLAFDEAARRGATLTAVHSCELPPAPWPDAVWAPDITWEASQAQRVQGWIQPWQDKYPDVAVTPRVTTERPAAALIAAAHEAALIVVGSRGHGGFAGLLLGSVSQQLIHHAPCPVVVVR